MHCKLYGLRLQNPKTDTISVRVGLDRHLIISCLYGGIGGVVGIFHQCNSCRQSPSPISPSITIVSDTDQVKGAQMTCKLFNRFN